MANLQFKYQRNYYLRIQKTNTDDPNDPKNFIVVQPPLTIEFDIKRTYVNSDNRVMITVYGLNQSTRESVFKDYWDGFTVRMVYLQAGYGDGPQLPLIFGGRISACSSSRPGTAFKTVIEAYDPGSALSSVVYTGGQTTYDTNTSYDSIIRALINSITHAPYVLQVGQIETVPGVITGPYSVDKPVLETVQQLCEWNNYYAFIDNNKINVLPKNQPLLSTGKQETISLIDASTGLIGSPQREGGQIFFDIIFDPTINVGQQVLLLTLTGGSKFIGQYMVNTVQHKGIISDSKAGQLTTTIGAFYVGALANAK